MFKSRTATPVDQIAERQGLNLMPQCKALEVVGNFLGSARLGEEEIFAEKETDEIACVATAFV